MKRYTWIAIALSCVACSSSDEGSDNDNLGAPAAVCGDGVLSPDEECDGTLARVSTCVDLGFAGGQLACGSSCTLDTSACFECGDGRVTEGEECDGTALAGQTCEDAGFAPGGTLACTSTCQLDTSGCTDCGNNIVDTAEECDGSDFLGASCISEGFDGGTLGCSDQCAFETDGCFECGDGLRQAGELCDGTDLGGTTCEDLGLISGALSCTAACGFDTSSCESCGNGLLDDGEECDQLQLDGARCEDFGLVSGFVGCTSSCTLNTTQCLTCGNGLLDSGEECDGANFGSNTCANENPLFNGGSLSCTVDCRVDTSTCNNCGTANCDPNAACFTLNNCTCDNGYSGDGESCENIDECADTPDPCVGLPNDRCVDTDGSFECLCEPGFILDGDTCVPDCPKEEACDDIPNVCDSLPDGVDVGLMITALPFSYDSTGILDVGETETLYWDEPGALVTGASILEIEVVGATVTAGLSCGEQLPLLDPGLYPIDCYTPGTGCQSECEAALMDPDLCALVCGRAGACEPITITVTGTGAAYSLTIDESL